MSQDHHCRHQLLGRIQTHTHTHTRWKGLGFSRDYIKVPQANLIKSYSRCWHCNQYNMFYSNYQLHCLSSLKARIGCIHLFQPNTNHGAWIILNTTNNCFFSIKLWSLFHSPLPILNWWHLSPQTLGYLNPITVVIFFRHHLQGGSLRDVPNSCACFLSSMCLGGRTLFSHQLMFHFNTNWIFAYLHEGFS